MKKVVLMESNGDFAKEVAEYLNRSGVEVSGIADDDNVG